MSRIVTSSVLTLFVMTAAAPADAPPAREFKTFASEKGQYTIEMPGKPVATAIKAENGSIEYRQTALTSAGELFTIVYVDLHGGMLIKGDPQKTLAAYRDGFRGGQKIVKDRDITLGEDKVPGREYLIELNAADDIYLRVRVYLAGTRIYILTLMGEKDQVNSRAADRFFESFRLTEKVGAADEQPKIEFQKFKSDEARFTIDLPGKPREKSENLENGRKSYRFPVSVGKTQRFEVICIDFPAAEVKGEGSEELKQVYPLFWKKVIKILEEKAITFGEKKIPGVDYTIQLEGAQLGSYFYVRGRCLVNGTRLYDIRLVSLGDKDFLTSKEANRFFESFEFTK